MILEKEILGQIKKDYFFLTGKLKIKNTDYFINKIREGVQEKNNQNYRTNVFGFMTSWKYFVNDKEFLTLLFPLLDKIDSYNFSERYELDDAWGLIEGWSGRTKEHSHSLSYMSGVIYFNNHPQELIFPEINQKVKPKVGKFVLFSSDLKHLAHRNTCNEEKYAIAFNFKSLNQYD